MFQVRLEEVLLKQRRYEDKECREREREGGIDKERAQSRERKWERGRTRKDIHVKDKQVKQITE